MAFYRILLFFALFTGAGCQKSSPSHPLLLVSLGPYKFLVERIVRGSSFEVETLIPPQADPHTFEPTLQKAIALERASVWFCIGEPFEKKLLSSLEERGSSLVLSDLREGVPLLEEDRHVWLDPQLALLQAEEIAKVLSETFPEKEALFLENLVQLREELTRLDQEIASLIEPLRGQALLVSHPAFGYFCHRYGLIQLSLEHEGKEARPHHLEEVYRQAEESEIACALTMPQHSSRGLKRLAKKLHLPLHAIDPYSSDYVELFSTLMSFLQEGKS